MKRDLFYNIKRSPEKFLQCIRKHKVEMFTKQSDIQTQIN